MKFCMTKMMNGNKQPCSPKGKIYFLTGIVGDEGSVLKDARGRISKYTSNDLPPWYVAGRYYKQFGYMSAKGVKEIEYLPSCWTEHFLKDDCLLVSYRDKITQDPNKGTGVFSFLGYDERIWGSTILYFLRALKEYSPSVDSLSVIEQIKKKQAYLQKKYPEFNYDFDIDKFMELPE